MNILDTIIAQKRIEVAERRLLRPLKVLEKMISSAPASFSLKASLCNPLKTGIIAEFKRRSPSKGVINAGADVVVVTRAYTENGAAGLSVLTDEQFFGGSTADLTAARINEIPILRKDFIIDEYQIAEAKSMGADVILLIAANLSPVRVKELAKEAKNYGLEVLLELHAGEELEHICDDIEIVGINNRNLKTFEVDIERSLRMAEQIPVSTIKVAESGISTVENILVFKQHGFRGFLIGENFMKAADPTIAFAEFVQQLKSKSDEN